MTVGQYRVIATDRQGKVTFDEEFPTEVDAMGFAIDVKKGWVGVDFPEDRAHVYVAKEVTL